ncbi:MAG: hypothetical protein ACSHWV_09175 [Cellulophaga fucicola]
MGNKIITEKDFWMCTGGNMPAPLQAQQKIAKKKSGEKFITKIDTSTSSIIDFGCKKLMLIMAIVAAVIAVCVVATGGAALIAIGAMAGAGGAAIGAVAGGLICGQVAAMARMWLDSKDKPNKGFYILKQPVITGDHKMKCMLFGDEIKFAPEIKNWWQALAIGGANLITGVMEGMMYGAMVGMGGAAVGSVRTLISQGGVQLSKQAGLNFLKTNGVNMLKNFSSGLTGDWLMKAADGSVGWLNQYGNTGSASVTDFTSAVSESAMGDITAIKNTFSGNGSSDDFIALVMLFAPGGKPKKGDGASSSTHADANSSKKSDGSDSKNTKDVDDGTVHKSHTPDADTPNKKKKGEAYEADSKKSKNWKEHEKNVTEDLKSKNPDAKIGDQITLDVEGIDDSGKPFKARIRIDNMHKDSNGKYQLTDAKFSSKKDLTSKDVNLRNTFTKNQKKAYDAIGNGRATSVTPMGQKAKDFDLEPGKPIQVNQKINIGVNNSNGGTTYIGYP